MANSWLRLWHDMPTDPKFGTVARVSGEHITLVLSVYLHLLVDASRNVTRGHVGVTDEDLATALNVTDDQIAKVRAAMEGRLVANGVLLGWDKRQVKREDSGDEETGAKSQAQRKAEQRAREKAARELAELAGKSQQVTGSHGKSRNVTPDKEKDKEKDSSVAKATASNAGLDQSELTKAELWTAGKSLLEAGGMPKGQCGSFVGKLVKDYGDQVVVDAVRSAVVTQPADPAQYLKATCQQLVGQRRTPTESFAERDERLAAERYREAIGQSAKPPKPMGEVIDITPKRISQ